MIRKSHPVADIFESSTAPQLAFEDSFGSVRSSVNFTCLCSARLQAGIADANINQSATDERSTIWREALKQLFGQSFSQ
jgi:hypothetical protein